MPETIQVHIVIYSAARVWKVRWTHQLARQQWHVLNYSQTHPPFGIFRQFHNSGQQGLRKLANAYHLVNAVQVGDDVQAHLRTLQTRVFETLFHPISNKNPRFKTEQFFVITLKKKKHLCIVKQLLLALNYLNPLYRPKYKYISTDGYGSKLLWKL